MTGPSRLSGMQTSMGCEMTEVHLIEYNHNGVTVDYFETMAVAASKDEAEIVMKALSYKFRNGKLRVRKLPIEDGSEEKYDSWIRTRKEE